MASTESALIALSIARQAEFGDAAVQVYLHSLSDLDPLLIAKACGELAREPRAEFSSVMPSVGDIRDRVDKVAHAIAVAERAAKVLPMPKDIENEPRYFCLDCRDEASGWRMFYCKGSGALWADEVPRGYTDCTVQNCGRPKMHPHHPFTERCHCWQKNPAVAELKRKLTGTKR